MTMLDRRAWLASAGAGFGALAAHALLTREAASADGSAGADELAGADERARAVGRAATRAPHFAPRADAVIFLFMYGGPSQVDTFDPKPALARWAGKPVPAFRPEDAFFASETKPVALPSPWRFAKHGQSGLEMSELFPCLAARADDLCVLRSLRADSNNHGPALSQLNSGFLLPGHPTLGSWLGYGLGSANDNLPGYVVLLDKEGAPVNGAINWSNGFMPARFQGVPLRASGPPIAYLNTAPGVSSQDQQARLRLLERFNRQYAERDPLDTALDARLAAYELAFRMQTHAPEVADLAGESQAARQAYGLDDPVTAHFGRNCLLARRLVERGVRFVQVYSGGNAGPTAWDAHKDLVGNHQRQCRQTDRPIAALLADLSQRGLLERTLVVWGGEFGRMPTQQAGNGRDHNPFGFTMWLAGGGARGGQAIGATDEFGYRAVEKPFHVHDLHATLLHLLGLDHKRLTFRHNGRDFRLTDVQGTVITEALA